MNVPAAAVTGCNAVQTMLDSIFSQGAEACHFFNAIRMADVLSNAPVGVLCMGNADPAGQFAQGTPKSIRQSTWDLMRDCGEYINFLPSSDCDTPAHSSLEKTQAFFEAL